ncbi:MAG: cellulose binding domain-containing protein [Oscillospiraceae bacterium]|nr:cellulose binding domain-containing protein [Oscillospiraceae bacterium]
MKHRIIAGITSVLLSANIITALPENAFAIGADDSKVYEKDGYTVTYRIGSEWDNNRSVDVVIENTGSEPILNWALKYDAGGELYNLWNSSVYDRGENYTIIKNSGYNYEIEAGKSVNFGYIVTGAETLIPDDIELCSRRIDVKSGYDVELNVTSNWYTGFNADISITNTSDEPIEAWTLSFDGNFDITNIWNAKLLSAEDRSYETANQLWTTPIKVGETATFGISADKSATDNISAENFNLTAVIINESSLEKEPEISYPDYPYENIDYELDSDNDGLPDYYEDIIGTNKNSSDTDGDGLTDSEEFYYLGTDPTKADSDGNGINDGAEDFDNDGLTNAEEIKLGTNPNAADTDNDGLTDSAEINTYGTDPLKYDTDGDGISDGDEVALGLDPKNGSTDGTSDSERTFAQTLDKDSETFSPINDNEENPFDVSLEIKAAGVAENNLVTRESIYTNVIQSSAVIGVAPEFVYTDGLSVEEVTVKFELENSAVNNTLDIYSDESDEFKGIKRLNIFMFFEDINMLLPVETFHDTENNIVYTQTDRVGTYCLVDMEIFLDNLSSQLGQTAEVEDSEAMSNSDTNTYKVRQLPAKSKDTKDKDDFDVVFLIDFRSVLTNENYALIQKNITETATDVFMRSPNAKIKFVEMMPINNKGVAYKSINRLAIGDYSDSLSKCFYNIDEVQKVLEYITNDTTASGKKSCNISGAVSYVYDLCYGRDTYVFCFAQNDGLFYESKNGSAYSWLDKIKKSTKPINISVFFDENPNKQYGYALDMANETNGMICTSFDKSSELMLSHIYGDTEIKNSYRAIVATGYRRVTLNQSLQENYDRYVQAPMANYPYQSAWDTDNDHVMDHEEIMFQSKDQHGIVKNTVKVDEDGNVDLYTFGEITNSLNNMIGNINERLFYVEKGLVRYKATTAETYPNEVASLMNTKVLPIWSDPNLGDSDSDDIPDRLDGDSLVDDKFPIIYKDLINSSIVDYSDITMPYLNCYVCSASLERIARYVDTASLSGFDKLGNYGISSETLACLNDYYMFAYGEEEDADYYVCQWADYNFLKQRKVIRQAKEVRKYTGVNFDEISEEYASYDFWCVCAKNSQKWLDSVNEADEKNLEFIDKVIDNNPTAIAFIIEFTPTDADDEVLTSYNNVVKGVCHGLYSETDIVTKVPAVALTVPKSVIENDYIFRKNFKETYGIDLPKYITVIKSAFDYLVDDLFMQLDDIDTNLLSEDSATREQYIGELLGNVIFDMASVELSSEIARQQQSKTPDNAKIAKLENELDGMHSKREFEKGDGSFSITLSKASAEAYPRVRKKLGSLLDELLSEFGEHADEIIDYADKNEDDFKYITKNHIPIFLATLVTNPQYLDNKKELLDKFAGYHKQEPFKAEPNAYDLRVAQYGLAKVYEKYTRVTDTNDIYQALEDELLEAGVYTPPYRFARHHIIPFADGNCPKASKMLKQYGIDKNSAANAVFLPKEPLPNDPEKNHETLHSGNHINKYYKTIEKEFEDLEIKINSKNWESEEIKTQEGRKMICAKIHEIRLKLLRNEISLNHEYDKNSN